MQCGTLLHFRGAATRICSLVNCMSLVRLLIIIHQVLCVCAYTRMCKYTRMHSVFRIWARNDKCKNVHDARPAQSANVSVSGTCFLDTIAI